MRNIFTALLGAAIGLASMTGVASASSGTVTGNFTFLQKQANCGSGNGVKYPCSQLNTSVPVKFAKVNVRRASDNKVLGTSYTKSDGSFSVAWTDSSVTGNESLNMEWLGIDQDGRFQVGSQTVYSFWINAFTATNGGTTNIGNRDWGDNPHAQVYDGAERLWQTLKTSNRLNTYWGAGAPKCPSGVTCGTRTNIMISDTGRDFNLNTNACATGATWANQNWVCLPDSTTGHYGNLSRVMHELGHMAAYVSNRDQQFYWVANYRRDDPACCATAANNDCDGDGVADCNLHGYTTAENDSPGYQEALADHWAHVGLYGQNADQAFTCVSGTSACTAANGFSLEARPSSCANESRWQLSGERYFWDCYDTLQDTGSGQTDTLGRNIWEFADTNNAFDPGFNTNKARDEVLNSSLQVVDADGHSTLDFKNNWITWGTDSTPQLTMNCSPAGAD